MNGKKYRLQKVLDIRNRAKDDAARRIALRYQQLAQAEEDLNLRQRRLVACYKRQNRAQETMQGELEKGVQAKNIVAHRTFLYDLREKEVELQAELDKQAQAVLNAERNVEVARENLIAAARELKAIEVHKAHWQSAERSVRTKQDQKISDEIGSILHGRGNPE